MIPGVELTLNAPEDHLDAGRQTPPTPAVKYQETTPTVTGGFSLQ